MTAPHAALPRSLLTNAAYRAQLLESDDQGFRLPASRTFKYPQIMIPAIRRFSFGPRIRTGRFDQHEPFRAAALARHVIDGLECNRGLTI
jgi:hypothetical protein